ncbi:hypothetical protein VNO80_07192 [Phaseolus coccineus]|uniref:S-adenosylmethionine synthetase C-terminal domain-containing protein n=1 Tax=Phaseolus coccineus TaxID=3886 RepID=A0AAN9RJN8_PHACN
MAQVRTVKGLIWCNRNSQFSAAALNTFGRWDAHGCDAFNGKDHTKVDRIYAYFVPVDSYGIGNNLDKELLNKVLKIAAYELFGREESVFKWEVV